jgi:hypothetical protein
MRGFVNIKLLEEIKWSDNSLRTSESNLPHIYAYFRFLSRIYISAHSAISFMKKFLVCPIRGDY